MEGRPEDARGRSREQLEAALCISAVGKMSVKRRYKICGDIAHMARIPRIQR